MNIEKFKQNQNYNNYNDPMQRARTTNRGWCVRNDHGNFIDAGTGWDSCNLHMC